MSKAHPTPDKENEMRHPTAISVAVVAAFAASMLSAAVASAEAPEFNPATDSSTVSGGAFKFTEAGKGLFAVECTNSQGLYFGANAKGGHFEETFEGCKAALSGKCTGLADLKGEITVTGQYDLRFLAGQVGKESAALAFLINPVHFECEKTIVLIGVAGCVAGSVTPLNNKTKTFTVELNQIGGVESIKEVENEANTGSETCVLKSKKNSETEKEAGWQYTDTVSAEKELEVIT
jgi:hypothetical protein